MTWQELTKPKLSHATLAALHAAELPVHGVVLIGDQNRENRETIERFGHVRVIGEVPRLPNLHRTALIQVFMNHFDRSAFQTARSSAHSKRPVFYNRLLILRGNSSRRARSIRR